MIATSLLGAVGLEMLVFGILASFPAAAAVAPSNRSSSPPVEAMRDDSQRSDATAVPGASHEREPLASAGCGSGPFTAAHGDVQRLTSDGEERTYILDAPASPAGRPLPIVLSFHGFRDDAANHRRYTGWAPLSEREGFVTLYPQGHDGVRLLGTIGRGWDMRSQETRDVEFVRALLTRVERERCIDRRRIFATGMSNGGFFANLLGCKLADRLAAIAPVAGAMSLAACAPGQPIPVLLIFGRADDVVPPSLMRGARDWWAEIDHCGARSDDRECARYASCAADLVSCEGPQAHVWPPDATERIWRFFQTHPRSALPEPPSTTPPR